MIAFVDTETLGLDPDRHAVWEVALILFDETADEDPVRDVLLWHVELTSGEIVAGDPFAMEMTGFHDRYGRDVTVTPKDRFLEQFVTAVGDAHLAGAVVSFDEERLRRLARSYGIEPRWHYHLIDVEALMVGYLYGEATHYRGGVPRAMPTLPWSSKDLSLAVGVDPADHEPAHTALADAGWALACYRAVTS